MGRHAACLLATNHARRQSPALRRGFIAGRFVVRGIVRIDPHGTGSCRRMMAA
jgi:hypothetical protein